MRSFEIRPKATEQLTSVQDRTPNRTGFGRFNGITTIENAAEQPLAETDPHNRERSPRVQAANHLSHDFSRIRVHSAEANGFLPDPAERARSGPGLEANASDIRIHTGQEAAVAAAALGADAYTVGRHIFFGAGRFQPGTQAGRHLMMHELAHVVQQQKQRPTVATRDALEQEANQAARDAVAGRPMRIRLSAPLSQPQRQATKWKPDSDVLVDPTAARDIMMRGGLFSGNDQAHITVARGVLTYDLGYTAPEDQFRWSRLKDIVDNGFLKISAVSAQQKFKVQETPGAPPVDSSIADIRRDLNDMSVMGITLIAGSTSPDQTFNMIFYDQVGGVGALAHEFFGHEWLSVKGAPSVHPPAGSAAEKTRGTISPGNLITDPFGNIFSGTVRDYIAKYIESLAKTATVTTAKGGRMVVPKSPTQNVGVDALTKAFAILVANVSTGLTATSYSAPIAQAWRIICNNYDLMQTTSEAVQAGNSNLMNTKEVLLAGSSALFASWTAAQMSGFRILLADFTGQRAGFTTNELSAKLEARVGAAPSIFSP